MKRWFVMVGILWLVLLLIGGIASAYGQIGPAQKGQPKEIDSSGNFQVPSGDMNEIPGISGPATPSPIRESQQQSWQRYSQGSSSRLAVLVADPTSDWLGLAHGLKSIGVPFVLTRDYREAVQHKMVLSYPMISGKTMSPEAIAALTSYAKGGGTLVAVQPLAHSMQALFGYTEAVPSRQHRSISFKQGSLSRPLEDPRETVLTLNGTRQDETMGSYSFLYPQGQVVATYEDGDAAIVKREYGRGAAYAVGIDLGHWLLNGYNSRAEASARSYVNEYEPTLDILMQWLREVYQTAEPDAVTMSTVPEGKPVAIILTHDIDFNQSVVNAVSYAEYEKSMNIRSTYFLQTKYIRDFYDEIFYNDKYIPYIKELQAKGMELASHTVSHTRLLSDLPVGSGSETYPTYQPYISGFYSVHNATVFGEVRVSKFLVEQVTGQPVVSFRAGHLANPTALPQVLAASGYRYSSNVTANTALTHLPFQLTYSRSNGDEVNVYEFPLTIEDELDAPMDSRLDKAIALGQKLSQYGGSMVVLIHPNILGPKLAFEKGLVNAFRELAWFGALEDYGKWWAARDHVEIDVKAQGNLRMVRLRLAEEVNNLALQVPAGWRLQEGPGRQQGSRVLVTSSVGETILVFQMP